MWSHFVLGLFFLTFLNGSIASRPAKRHYSTHDYYLLEHDPSVGVPVEHCAAALGAEVIEQAGELADHWLLRIPKSDSHWQLDRRSLQEGDLAASVKRLELQVPRQRVKRIIPEERAPPLNASEHSAARDVAERLGIMDPLFTEQWHLVNEEYAEHTVNVTPVWDLGIAGEGVISALVDDGLDYESDDLADNFYAEGSHDFNDGDDLPGPKLYDDHHGTRCAGQIAAGKNTACGVGIAYKSKVAGIRILSGPISDVDEAAALNYGYQNISIYSCSWGPPDDGRSMEAPNFIVQKAILNGIQNGRSGKGSVFVFASGNGAYSADQCNFDGYTNSIYSVTVAAVDYSGKHPAYSEACAANMVVTYSSGSNPKKSIVTTDVGKDKCTESHGGTSAAAPNAAGVFALALSVRPDLTWRDVQHLCVQTAKVINPGEDWEVTAAGRPYSYTYGYGRLDAFAYVEAAQNWQNVKPQAWVEMPAIQIVDGQMDANGTFTGGELIGEDGVSSSVSVAQDMLQRNNFEKVEHVTVTVWIEHTRRGDVEVELISPNGVHSKLASLRKRDTDSEGFQGWKFMSIKHWDEDPVGDWTVQVSDQASENESGHFIGWQLTLWGSSIDASKATPYVLTSLEGVPFPPPEVPHIPEPTEASTTKNYPKPTVTVSHTSEVEEPSTTSEGSEDELGDVENSQEAAETIATIIGTLAFFLIAGGGAFLIIRRIRQRRQEAHRYTRVDVEDVRMGSLDGSRLTGRDEVVWDADEDNERQPLASNSVAFHSGFLDDEEPSHQLTPGPSSHASDSVTKEEQGPGDV